MKLSIKSWLLLGITALSLAACTKGNDDYVYTAELMPIVVKGYNATSEPLSVKIDTVALPAIIFAQSSFNVSEVFNFDGGPKTVKLSVTEKNTGKTVLEKELRKEDAPATFSFLYMDGKVLNMPEKPAVVAEKISLIYMFIPDVTKYSEPVDLVIGKYFITPTVFEELARIKNVKPNEFSEPATISTFSTARQDYNGVMTSVSFQVRIYKAGTNTPYTDGTAYTWVNASSTAPKPAASAASSKLYIISEAPFGTQMRFNTRLDL